MLNSLSEKEIDDLRDLIRFTLAKSAPGAERLQLTLRQQLRELKEASTHAGIAMSAVKVQGGVWVFYHTGARTDAVILEEAFLPLRPGTRLPQNRPDPSAAGLAGKPRWIGPDKRPSSSRPPMPVSPNRLPSGLPAQALERGPDIVLAELLRAEDEARAAAGRPRPTRSESARRRAHAQKRGWTGSRIQDIQEHTAEAIDGEWDQRFTIKMATGPEVSRELDAQMDEVLRRPSQLPDEKYRRGFARCHAVGPILGDETLVGLAYCPHKAFNLLQKSTVEEFLRWGKKAGKALNIRAETPVTVRVYIQHVNVGDRREPFLRAAHYSIELEDGSHVTAVLAIDADGKVTTDILR
jgi:hypothetical protein